MAQKMADSTRRISHDSLMILLLISGLIQGCCSIESTTNNISLFNGSDLTGWSGLIAPPARKASLSPSERAKEREEADRLMSQHWHVQENCLFFDGKGSHLVTIDEFGDFELCLEWKITPGGDSGIYLRGCPQVQIWDVLEHPEGSGGLYNNKLGGSLPLVAADHPPGNWNHFRIQMRGDKVTVYLNDTLVVNDTKLENYWDRSKPTPSRGPIELQSHGSPLFFRYLTISPL
ncbi:MAG: DUF1080 domain-containing protein [Planctomycetia bacterium]|nr:DUF1080 domain-containing protein [Planctomycetia bacterium]